MTRYSNSRCLGLLLLATVAALQVDSRFIIAELGLRSIAAVLPSTILAVATIASLAEQHWASC